MNLEVLIEQTEIAKGLPLPRYAHEGDVCVDIPIAEDAIIPAFSGMDIRTGLHVVPPPGYYLRVVGRGLAAKLGFFFTLEVIDRLYRGEIILHPWNASARAVELKRGDRIAQLELLPVTEFAWKIGDVRGLQSKRGTGRLGSTGR